MGREIVRTTEAPGSDGRLPYSQAVKAAGLVFVAGQAPTDAATGSVVGETIQDQTRQCLRNVEAILRAAGSSMDKIVSATFILRDPDDFAGFNEEWVRWFATDPPARQGAKHPLELPMRISIAVIAEA
jgi:2-iminobutanoate/2-iminopropanoate deaminase